MRSLAGTFSKKLITDFFNEHLAKRVPAGSYRTSIEIPITGSDPLGNTPISTTRLYDRRQHNYDRRQHNTKKAAAYFADY
jgi:hypothetical protein